MNLKWTKHAKERCLIYLAKDKRLLFGDQGINDITNDFGIALKISWLHILKRKF
jgi:hypothetical protein